jgi:hypothetical protein
MAVAGLVLAAARPAMGQYVTGFEAGEGYAGQAASAGNPPGPTQLVPQNGWANQFGNGFDVHTYAGSQIPWSPQSKGVPEMYNAPVNLTGGRQFVALGNSDGGTGAGGRDWRAMAHEGLMEFSVDYCNGYEREFGNYQGGLVSRGNWSGAGPGNMVGVYSTDASTAVGESGPWAFHVLASDANGVRLTNPVPNDFGPFYRFNGAEGFDNLPRESWWRMGYVIDMDPGSPTYRRVVQLKSQDLSIGGEIWTIDNPQAWQDNPLDPGGFIGVDMYIFGGAAGAEVPDSVGLYNSDAGTLSMYDNLYIGAPYDWRVVPEPATMAVMLMGGFAVLRRRRGKPTTATEYPRSAEA